MDAKQYEKECSTTLSIKHSQRQYSASAESEGGFFFPFNAG